MDRQRCGTPAKPGTNGSNGRPRGTVLRLKVPVATRASRHLMRSPAEGSRMPLRSGPLGGRHILNRTVHGRIGWPVMTLPPMTFDQALEGIARDAPASDLEQRWPGRRRGPVGRVRGVTVGGAAGVRRGRVAAVGAAPAVRTAGDGVGGDGPDPDPAGRGRRLDRRRRRRAQAVAGAGAAGRAEHVDDGRHRPVDDQPPGRAAGAAGRAGGRRVQAERPDPVVYRRPAVGRHRRRGHAGRRAAGPVPDAVGSCPACRGTRPCGWSR